MAPEIRTIKFKKLVPSREIVERDRQEIEAELEKAVCDFLITHGFIKIKVEKNDMMDAQEVTAWLHVAEFPNEL